MKLRWLLPFLFTLPAFAAGGACPSGIQTIQADGTPSTIANVGITAAITGGITSCFYADLVNGADTNAGTTEGAPWKHIPGQTGCANTCSSTTPTAGEGFILKGGVTWTTTAVNNWTWSGSSTHPIYIGVDKTWFTNVTGTCSISGSTCTWVSGLRAPYTCPDGANCSGDFGYLDSVTNNTITLNGSSCTVSATPAKGSSNVISFTGCSPGAGTISFSYAFWTRPIFNTSGSAQILFNAINQSWVILDNVEVIGFQNNRAGFQNTGGSNSRATQMFWHAWTHTGASNNSGFYHQGGTGTVSDHNIMDGSDGSKNTMNGFFQSWDIAQYDYISYVVSGVLGAMNTLHHNIVEQGIQSVDGDHCNLVFTFSTQSGSGTMSVHDNLVRKQNCAGGIIFWLSGNNACSTCTTYAYNNIIDADSGFSIGGHVGNTYGTFNIMNNTISASGAGNCMGNGEAGIRSTTNIYNTHCIGPNPSGGLSSLCNGAGTTCNDDGGNLIQTLGTANGQGYTASEALEFSPIGSCTGGTCSTLAAGNNLNPVCNSATCPGLNSAVNYPSYNSNNNTMGTTVVSPAGNARGTSWDIGAYQFAGGGGSPATSFAPTSLSFGNQVVSTTSAGQSTTLTNTGTATLNITSITLQTGTQFAISANTCGSTLGAGSNCSVTVTFTPTSGGAKTDNIEFTDNAAGSPQAVPLSGTGTTVCTLPTFSPVSGTVFNAPSVVTMSTSCSTICYTTDGSPPTALSGACINGTSGTSVTIRNVLENVNALGTQSGFTNSSIAAATYTLNLPAPAPATNMLIGEVNPNIPLNWTASVTPGVNYAIYRATTSGGTYTRVQQGIVDTSWTDKNVTRGQAYWYKNQAYYPNCTHNCRSSFTSPLGVTCCE